MSSLEKQSPIFILSFCWRTGSTLLQRVINSTGDALVWGEPHTLSQLFNSFRKFSALSRETEWARKQVRENGWQESWAPTIQPDLKYVDSAARSSLFELYGQAAIDEGFSRWGFKEVRPDAANNARFLRRIYPNCKIVFHYRDPVEVHLSISKTDFYSQFKDPFQPMKVWNKNALDVIALLEEGFDGFLIDHKQLTESEEVRKNLFEYIGIQYGDSVEATLSKKTGATSEGCISKFDLETIGSITKSGLSSIHDYSQVVT